MALTQTQVSHLYTSLMGRASEGNGSVYWMTHGTDMTSTAETMLNSAAVAAYFGDALDSDFGFITTLYANTLNKTVNGADGTIEDLAGITYWTGVLESGESTRAEMMVRFIDRVVEIQNTAPTAASQQFTNRVEVSNYTADTIASAPADYATSLAFQNSGATGLVVTDDAATITTAEAAVAAIASSTADGLTYALTTGIDNISGTTGNDTINAIVDSATPANSTLTALDTINGATGNDTLNVLATGALTTAVAGLTVSNVETATFRAGTTIATDTTAWTGLTNVNTTQSTDATVTAAATTSVAVSGATGDIDVAGGKDVSVTDSTAVKNIQVGESGAGTTNAAGTITVTDSNQTTGTIEVDGGTDVTVTATSAATSGNITIGANTGATGDVVVTQNTTSDGTAATAGNITVTGGSTITATANMTNTATVGKGANITAGTITANAGNTTTEVTVTQNSTATDLAAVTTGNVTETAVLTFGALASGEAAIVGVTGGATGGTDLTFVASKALTAAEVAAAFASLTAADTQGAGGKVANGVFTGDLDAGWTSTSVSGSTVTFTSTTADTNVANFEVYTDANGTGVADNGAADDATFAAATTAGAAGTTVAAQNVTADFGAVVVNDNATASVTNITLDGYDTATLGGGVSLDALTTLSLSNSAGANTLTSASTSLTANLDGITGTTNLGGNVTTLTVNTSGTATATALTAGALTALTVNAGANLTVTPTSIAALETLTVTGAGNVTMGDISAATTTITAGSATGAISATVDGTKATVTTGSGNDSITVDTAAISKAINLGAGSDTLTLATGSTTVPTASVDGGAGTDTISMTVASAVAYDNNTNFASAITGFDRLTISDRVDVTGGVTLDLEALGFDSYVSLAGGTDDSADAGADTVDDGDTLTLNNMAANATVVLSNTQTQTGHANLTSAVVATLKDATGSSDVFNVMTTVAAADVNVGTLTVAGVETINITANDTNVDEDADGTSYEAGDRDLSTLDLNATSATTITIDGNANLTLDNTGNTAATTINGSAMTGALTVTSYGATATTITGGSGNDSLTASTTVNSDVLNGGAGNDDLYGFSLTQMTGGAGVDTFYAGVSVNVNSASAILDASSGDIIELIDNDGDIASFNQASITLDPDGNPDLQNYADAAIIAITADNGAAWFQYNNNTYIVMEDNNAAGNSFVNNEDVIVKLAGLVDLSTSSFNADNGTIELA